MSSPLFGVDEPGVAQGPMFASSVRFGASVPGKTDSAPIIPPNDFQEDRHIFALFNKKMQEQGEMPPLFIQRQLWQQACREVATDVPTTSGRVVLNDDTVDGFPVHLPHQVREFGHNGIAPRGHSRLSRLLAVCGNLCWNPACPTQIRRIANGSMGVLVAPAVDPSETALKGVPEWITTSVHEHRFVKDKFKRNSTIDSNPDIFRRLVCQTCGKLFVRYFHIQPHTHTHHNATMEEYKSNQTVDSPATEQILITKTTRTIPTWAFKELFKIRSDTWVRLGFPRDHDPIDACIYSIRTGGRAVEAYQDIKAGHNPDGSNVLPTPDEIAQRKLRGLLTPLICGAGTEVKVQNCANREAAHKATAFPSRSRSERDTAKRGFTGSVVSGSGTDSHKTHDVMRVMYEDNLIAGAVGATQTAFFPRFDVSGDHIHPCTVVLPSSVVFGLEGENSPLVVSFQMTPEQWLEHIDRVGSGGRELWIPYRVTSMEGVEIRFGLPRLVNGGIAFVRTESDRRKVDVWPQIRRSLARGEYGTVMVTFYTLSGAVEINRSPEFYELPSAVLRIAFNAEFEDIPLHGSPYISTAFSGNGYMMWISVMLQAVMNGDFDGDRIGLRYVQSAEFEKRQASSFYQVRIGTGQEDMTLSDQFGAILALTSGGMCHPDALSDICIEVTRDKSGALGWDTFSRIGGKSGVYPWDENSDEVLDPFNFRSTWIAVGGTGDKVVTGDVVAGLPIRGKEGKLASFLEQAETKEESRGGKCVMPWTCHCHTDQLLRSSSKDKALSAEVDRWGQERGFTRLCENVPAPTVDFDEKASKYDLDDVVLKRCVGRCRRRGTQYRVTKEMAIVAAVFATYGLMTYRKTWHPHNLKRQLKKWLAILARSELPGVDTMHTHFRVLVGNKQELSTGDMERYLKSHPLALPVVGFPCDLKELQLAFKRVRVLHMNNHPPCWLYAHIEALCRKSVLSIAQGEVPLGDDAGTEREFTDMYRAAYIRDHIQRKIREFGRFDQSARQEEEALGAIKALTNVMQFPPLNGKERGALPLIVGIKWFQEPAGCVTGHRSESQQASYLLRVISKDEAGYDRVKMKEALPREHELEKIGKIGAPLQQDRIKTSGRYMLWNGMTTATVPLGEVDRTVAGFVAEPVDPLPVAIEDDLEDDSDFESEEEKESVQDIELDTQELEAVTFATIDDDEEEFERKAVFEPVVGLESSLYFDSGHFDGVGVDTTPPDLDEIDVAAAREEAIDFRQHAAKHRLFAVSPFPTPLHVLRLTTANFETAKMQAMMQFTGDVYPTNAQTPKEFVEKAVRPALCGCASVFRSAGDLGFHPRVQPLPMDSVIWKERMGSATPYGSGAWRYPVHGVEQLPSSNIESIMFGIDQLSIQNRGELHRQIVEGKKRMMKASQGTLHFVWTPPEEFEHLLCGKFLAEWFQYLMPSVVVEDTMQSRPPPLNFYAAREDEKVRKFKLTYPKSRWVGLGQDDNPESSTMDTIIFFAPVNAMAKALDWVFLTALNLTKEYRDYVGRVCVTHVELPELWDNRSELVCIDDQSGDKACDTFKQVAQLFQIILDNEVAPSSTSVWHQCLVSDHGICLIHDPAMIYNTRTLRRELTPDVIRTTCSDAGGSEERREWRLENEQLVRDSLEIKDFSIIDLVVRPIPHCRTLVETVEAWLFAHAEAFWLPPKEFKGWFVDGLLAVLNKVATTRRFDTLESIKRVIHNIAMQMSLDSVKDERQNAGMPLKVARQWTEAPSTYSTPSGVVMRVVHRKFDSGKHDEVHSVLDAIFEDPVCSNNRKNIDLSPSFLPVVFSQQHRPMVVSESWGETDQMLRGFIVHHDPMSVEEKRDTIVAFCARAFGTTPVTNRASLKRFRRNYEKCVVIVSDVMNGNGVFSPMFLSDVPFISMRVLSQGDGFNSPDVATIYFPLDPDAVRMYVVPAVTKQNKPDLGQHTKKTIDVTRLLPTGEGSLFTPERWFTELLVPELVALNGRLVDHTLTVTLPKWLNVADVLASMRFASSSAGVSIYPWVLAHVHDLLGAAAMMHARKELTHKYLGVDWASTLDGVIDGSAGRDGLKPSAAEVSLTVDVKTSSLISNQRRRHLFMPTELDGSSKVGKVVLGLGGTKPKLLEDAEESTEHRRMNAELDPFPMFGY